MSDLTPKLPEELQRTLEQYYSSPVPSAGFASRLDSQLQQKMKQAQNKTTFPERKSLMTTLRARPLMAVLIALLILLALTGVAYAIGKSLGYIPGIGIVNQSMPIRTLAEPVSITRDGITLIVKQMWVDSDQTFIQYSLEGWDPNIREPNPDLCLKTPILRLPDKEFMPVQPISVVNSIYELKVVYPAIPSTINDVTFVMPCVLRSLPGEAPENWELPLHLIPAPSNAVFPVIEIFTPIAETPIALPQTNASLPANGISLTLDRAVQMDDGYLIYLTIHWENANLGIDSFDPATLHLLDANGKEIPYDVDFEAADSAQATVASGQTILAIKTAPLQNAGSLTFTLDSVCASMASDVSFTFDPGSDPKPGQVWNLNQDIDIGNGYSMQVSKVSYDLTDGTRAMLNFDISSDSGVMYATLLDQAHPPQGGGGGGGATCSPGPFTTILYYSTPLPKGPITVTIAGFSVNLRGPWEAVWTPTNQP